MLRLASQRPELGVVSDQTGCPTWARNLAGATLQMLHSLQGDQESEKHSGIYHYCDATVTTWYDFASLIFQKAAELGILQNVPVLNAIKSGDFPQAARRPKYSVLDTQAVREQFSIVPAELGWSLGECLKDYQV
jgi:dTDP-4-dehydrorhamnose reductase